MATTSAHIDSEQKREEWLGMFQQAGLPFTATFDNTDPRSKRQNRLAWKWYGEIERHLGDTPFETVRATCKLECGVPIKRRDDPEWREWYDSAFRPLPYHSKLEFFERLDVPMTRDFSVRQMTEFLEAVQRKFAPAGVALTIPDQV